MEQGESEKAHLERELVKFKTAKRSRSPNLETAMLQVHMYKHTSTHCSITASAKGKVLKSQTIHTVEDKESD